MSDNQINVADRIKALESALVNLRQRLGDVTADLGRTPGNTRLVIERVSVLKLIVQAQPRSMGCARTHLRGERAP